MKKEWVRDENKTGAGNKQRRYCRREEKKMKETKGEEKEKFTLHRNTLSADFVPRR